MKLCQQPVIPKLSINNHRILSSLKNNKKQSVACRAAPSVSLMREQCSVMAESEQTTTNDIVVAKPAWLAILVWEVRGPTEDAKTSKISGSVFAMHRDQEVCELCHAMLVSRRDISIVVSMVRQKPYMWYVLCLVRTHMYAMECIDKKNLCGSLPSELSLVRTCTCSAPGLTNPDGKDAVLEASRLWFARSCQAHHDARRFMMVAKTIDTGSVCAF